MGCGRKFIKPDMKVGDNRTLNYSSERVVTYLLSFLLSTFIRLIGLSCVDRKISTQTAKW